jgi:hypothetical protein
LGLAEQALEQPRVILHIIDDQNHLAEPKGSF